MWYKDGFHESCLFVKFFEAVTCHKWQLALSNFFTRSIELSNWGNCFFNKQQALDENSVNMGHYKCCHQKFYFYWRLTLICLFYVSLCSVKKAIYNMVVEVPRWTNAKMEVCFFVSRLNNFIYKNALLGLIITSFVFTEIQYNDHLNNIRRNSGI